MVSEIDKQSNHVKRTEGHCISSEDLAKILEHHREQKDNLPVISLQYKVQNQRVFNRFFCKLATSCENFTSVTALRVITELSVMVFVKFSKTWNLQCKIPTL